MRVKILLFIMLFQWVYIEVFATPAPKSVGILKSYKISSPGRLCSNPNIEEFMFSIEGEGVTAGFYILKPNSFAQLDEFTDGTLRIVLSVVLKTDTSKEYLITIDGSNKTIGYLLYGYLPATNNCAAIDITNWSFYNTFKMTIIGQNGNVGQRFIFQSQQANHHTVQVGNGANTWQPSMGSGLWFDNANTNGVDTIRGDLQMELTPIQGCAANMCVPFTITKTH